MELAAGTVDITPSRPLVLAGYAERTAPFRRVADALEANVLVLRDGEARQVIVSVDLLYVGDLRDAILGQVPLTDAELFIAASHTHFAPATDSRLPGLGRADTDYVASCAERIAGLIDALLVAPAMPVTLRYHERPCALAINRRRKGLELGAHGLPAATVRMRANRSGVTDARLRALTLTDATGDLHACLWSFACHPVASPERLSVSSDYPGVVREAIRKRHGGALPVLFLQGFAGNSRPPALAKPRTLRQRLSTRIHGPDFAPYDVSGFQRFSGALARVALSTLEHRGTRLSGPLATGRSALPLTALLEGAPAGATVTLQRVAIGWDFELVGISAEPMAEHVRLLRRVSSCHQVMPVGCIDRVYGYLPRDRMLREGGYEVEGYKPHFGLSGARSVPSDATLRVAFERLGEDAPATTVQGADT